ncbi:MAG: carboxylating nicotinate-nucleotide diphosphorylase [Lentimicrobium sp.]|jgi:nicotinate-nucleotide pyrophosphorylase (carboxylating)|nr:carboxylating nicotinate-nucleotide diphosphorylase [Lentimicrobium sp.]
MTNKSFGEALTLDQIIELALAEDIGAGDYTSLSTIPAQAKGKARLLVKEAGVLSGIEVAAKVFEHVDPAIKFHPQLKDGDKIKPGDVAFTVEGPSASLLQAERLALNFMQLMSGIATYTAQYVDALKGLKTKVIDTRKTTPLLRALEKLAVIHGGGANHRKGLYDMILIKDNHVDFAGGIRQAIEGANSYLKDHALSLPIEIEVRNPNELEQVLSVGSVTRIMLDNFSPADLKLAVNRIGGQFETEASGGITLGTIRSYAETGVDFISVGALTHQIKSIDLSLKAF